MKHYDNYFKQTRYFRFYCYFSGAYACDGIDKNVKKGNRRFYSCRWAAFYPTAKEALEFIPALDVVIKAEGEYTMCELVDAYARGDSFDKVSGLFFRQKTEKLLRQKRGRLLKILIACLILPTTCLRLKILL